MFVFRPARGNFRAHGGLRSLWIDAGGGFSSTSFEFLLRLFPVGRRLAVHARSRNEAAVLRDLRECVHDHHRCGRLVHRCGDLGG